MSTACSNSASFVIGETVCSKTYTSSSNKSKLISSGSPIETITFLFCSGSQATSAGTMNPILTIKTFTCSLFSKENTLSNKQSQEKPNQMVGLRDLIHQQNKPQLGKFSQIFFETSFQNSLQPPKNKMT